tara:strand:- start:132 stop:302 length:171 start_codon:yes stop_codon:yes gene_type:complete
LNQFKKEFGNGKVKTTTVTISEISQDPTMRLDARYWFQKQLLKKRGKNGSIKKVED